MKKILVAALGLFLSAAAVAAGPTTVYVTNTSGVRSAMTLSDTLAQNVVQLGATPAANDCVKFMDTLGTITTTGAPCDTAAGTVTSFSAGNLSPLFTTSVATATTTPALSFSLSNAAANSMLANNTGSGAVPSYTLFSGVSLSKFGAPTADVPWGNFKITSLANGTASTDAAAFGQIPTSLPPSGAAGGILSGTYPNPGFASLTAHAVLLGNGTGVLGTATIGTAGRLLIDQGAAADPTFNAMSGDATISGIGALTFANTAVTPAAYGSATQVGTFTVDSKGRLTAAANVTITGTAPGGAAGGDIAGTYPNPTLAATIATNVNFTGSIGLNTAIGSQVGVLDVTSSAAATPDIVIHGVASQTGAYFRIMDSSSNFLRNVLPLSSVDPRPRDCWYNTLETTPTNYERGCIYFDNSLNAYRIETQNGGTGTLRTLMLQGGGGFTGIGITGAPAVMLDVTGLGTTNSARIGNTSARFFQFSGTAGANTLASVTDTSSPSPWIFSNTVTGGSANSNTYWGYTVNGVEVARMINTGALGIGAGSATQAKISLAGNTSGDPSLASHFSASNNTFTDTVTAASGTATRYSTIQYTAQSLAATNATVTTTNASIVQLSRPTIAGANETITNSNAILAIGGAITGTVTNSYVLQAGVYSGATNNYGIAVTTSGAAGNSGFGTLTPTAKVHLGAGSATASTAPLKFTSGTLLTAAEAGAEEFLTDKFYGTITTGAARKEFALFDAAGTSGRVPFETTNGRLTDVSGFTYNSGTSTLAAPTINATTALQSNGTTILPVLSGTTGSIGGGALLAGACASGTASVTGATTAMAVSASPVTYPGDGAYWLAYVSSSNTVTVKVCGAIALTPTASNYNVRVLQ